MGGFPFTRDGAFGCNWSTWARSRHHLSPGTQRGTGNATRRRRRSAPIGAGASGRPDRRVGAGRIAGWEPAGSPVGSRRRYNCGSDCVAVRPAPGALSGQLACLEEPVEAVLVEERDPEVGCPGKLRPAGFGPDHHCGRFLRDAGGRLASAGLDRGLGVFA